MPRDELAGVQRDGLESHFKRSLDFQVMTWLMHMTSGSSECQGDPLKKENRKTHLK
jgi:hypothetical protein